MRKADHAGHAARRFDVSASTSIRLTQWMARRDRWKRRGKDVRRAAANWLLTARF
jgi:hypothetical protein